MYMFQELKEFNERRTGLPLGRKLCGDNFCGIVKHLLGRGTIIIIPACHDEVNIILCVFSGWNRKGQMSSRATK